MNWRRKRRDFRLIVFGREWWIPTVGALTIVLYTFGAIAAYSLGVDLGPASYLAGAAGGLVTGLARGTNWSDGVNDGVRAAGIAVTVLAVLFTAIVLVGTYYLAGIPFLFWSPFVGAIFLLGMAPLYAFCAAIGGVAGVLLRRTAVPRQFNPPAR